MAEETQEDADDYRQLRLWRRTEMVNPSNTPNDKKSSIQDIIREIEQKSKGGGYIYRGERERHEGGPYKGKVSSSLWREYQIEAGHFDVELVQKELLAAAKKHTGDLPEDFRLDLIDALRAGEKSAEEAVDFEILTEIQHYGGKTNLIDFTTDYFIALFFACDGEPNKDGRVILQKIDAIRGMTAHPRNPRHRVIAQKSVFVRPPRGFIEPSSDEIVIVPACLKEKILEHLRTYHGISTEVIYNDLHGFIRNQDIHGDAYTAFYKGFACANKANEATISEEKEQEYEKVIGHYTKAIRLKPDLAEAYNNRGVAYEQKGDVDEAIQDYTKAIEVNPQHANAYTNRGAAYEQKGDVDEAIQDYTKAIEVNPQHANAYYNRGVAYGQKGDVDEAIQDYTKAIEVNPQHANAYYNRGVAYGQKGDVDEAIQDFNKAIDLNPQHAEAYNNRGNAYEQKGDVDEAIQDYTKAIEVNPQHANAYYNRGVAYGQKGDVDEAIQDFNKAIDLNPQHAEAYNNRGNAYEQKGDVDEAIQDYTKAIEVNPQHANAYYNRGVAYGQKGDVDEAIQDFNKAIEVNPQDTDAYYNRGQVWLRLREWEKAKADLSDAKDMGADFVALFHRNYRSVEDLEQRIGTQLPADLVALLTPQ